MSNTNSAYEASLLSTADSSLSTSARAPTPTTSRFPSLVDFVLRSAWKDPIQATSRTRDRLGHIDFGMVIPPIRGFLYCTLCPYLCYPIALVNSYGCWRCCQSIAWPKYDSRDKYAKHVMYAVQKRVYDRRRKRLAESPVDDVAEMQHALDVVHGVRHQFVDDPTNSGTAYAVVEQRIMKAEAVFTGENWAWAVISDTCRYASPILLAYLFHPACKRLTVDLKLWCQGRLYYKQIRHPLTNFFKTYSEFNQSMQRVNISKAPTGSKPWSRNL